MVKTSKGDNSHYFYPCFIGCLRQNTKARGKIIKTDRQTKTGKEYYDNGLVLSW